MKKRKNRSEQYQYMFNEHLSSNDMMADLPESAGLTAQMNGNRYSEEILDLQDQLKIEFWRLVETKLTDRQRQVVTLVAEGHTQTEIAKILGVNQSSITKSLNGNCDYRNGKRVYGGANKKLKKLVSQDTKIQAILARIADLSQD